MSLKWLRIFLADQFHYWIDGDDPVEEYKTNGNDRIWVKFESGSQFLITIEEVYE